MEKNDLLESFDFAANQIARYFTRRYFGKPGDVDFFWIGNDVGGMAHINDMFFTLEDMLTYLKNNASRRMMSEYYWYVLDEADNGRSPLKFKAFKHNKKKAL